MQAITAENYVGKEVGGEGAKDYFQFLLQIVNKFDLDEVQAKNLLPVGLKGPFRDLVTAMVDSNCSLTTIVPFTLTRWTNIPN